MRGMFFRQAWHNYFLFAAAALALIFFAFDFYTPKVVATPTWTSVTLASSATASSTRAMYDTYLGVFGVGYETSALSAIKFTTSSAGSSWASLVTVGSVSNLSGIVFFTTSSLANGAWYNFAPVTGGTSKVFQSSNQGVSFSSYDLNNAGAADYVLNGNVAAAAGPVYMVAGRVDIGGAAKVVFASTSASVNVFTTSSIASAAANPTVDMAYQANKLAIVYVIQSDTNLYMVTSSGFGPAPTWNSANYASGAGMIINPKVKIDSAGKIWVTYIAANAFNCSTYCEVRLARYENVGGWTSEAIDSVTSIDSNSRPDLDFMNGATPIIAYYSGSTLKYAYRDSGGSGCSGTDAASYTCGTIAASSGVGPISIASDHAYKAVIVYQSYPSTIKAAYTDMAPSSSSGSSAVFGLAPPTPIINPSIFINNNDATTSNNVVNLKFSAQNATQVAYSLNADFYGEIWRQYVTDATIKLSAQAAGTQRVYAKFANETGAISGIVWDDISYAPVVVAAPGATTTSPSLPPPVPAPPAPSISSAPQPVLPPPVELYNPGADVTPFLSENIVPSSPAGGGSAPTPQILCPERPNAFSLGGTIVRQGASGPLFLLIENMHVACPVASKTVAASWGVSTFQNKFDLSAYTESTPLPYRPGTIVQDSRSRARYFINTRGQRQQFPSVKQFTALGYGKNKIVVDTGAALASLPQAVSLTRGDIHPDGTMFVINARAGQYAILQNRALHGLTLASIRKYKENSTRAVKLLAGEHYPWAERWDK